MSRNVATRLALLTILVLATLAGCAGFGGDTPDDSVPAAGPSGPLPPESLANVTLSLDATPCEGNCPVYTVEVCGDGTVAYLGVSDVSRAGVHRYEIPRENVTAILDAASRADFFALEERYEAAATDLPATVTTVTIDGHTHRVVNEAWQDDAPEELSELESEIVEQTGIGPWIDPGEAEMESERARELYQRDSLCEPESVD